MRQGPSAAILRGRLFRGRLNSPACSPQKLTDQRQHESRSNCHDDGAPNGDAVDPSHSGFRVVRRMHNFASLSAQLRTHRGLMQSRSIVNRQTLHSCGQTATPIVPSPGRSAGEANESSCLGELDKALTTYSAFEGYDAADVAGTVHDVREEIRKLPQLHDQLWDLFRPVVPKSRASLSRLGTDRGHSPGFRNGSTSAWSASATMTPSVRRES